MKLEPGSFDFELGKYWKIETEYWIWNPNISKIMGLPKLYKIFDLKFI